MKDIYRRYFKITTGPIIPALQEVWDINQAAVNEYKAIAKEVGAKTSSMYTNGDGCLVALEFDDPPDPKLFKKVKSGGRFFGWFPKKTTASGKKLARRIEDVKTASEIPCLDLIGLGKLQFAIVDMKVLRVGVTFIPPTTAIVSVPTWDEDPKVVEKARQKIAEGSPSAVYRLLTFEPTEDMVEIKKWEVDRMVEEYNASLKKD